MKTHIVGLLAATLLVSFSASAHADPIAVTGGYVISDLDVSEIKFITQDFSVRFFGGSRPAGPGYEQILTLGTVQDFSATLTGQMVNVSDDSTVINGVAYRNQGDVLAVVNLQFTATPVLYSSRNISTPFTMTGTLQVFRNAGRSFDPVRGESILMTSVVGSGTLQPFEASGGPSFTFASTAAPTPEPATTALLTLGLAAFGAGARRKRT